MSVGASADTEVRITVAEGFHVQAHPAANEFLIPPTLTFDTGDDFEISGIRYPSGEPYRLQGADEDLLVYGDTFAVSIRASAAAHESSSDAVDYGDTFAVPVSIRASAAAHEDAVAVAGRLRYQACDDRLCLAPATLAFDLKVRIVHRGEK